MTDETSGIIGWPIGQQYRDMAARNEASSTITWETLVEQYRERAVRDGARIDELRQSTEHWHDTAQMLKRQRNTAERELDSWKVRAKTVEEQREAARDEADRWKVKWVVAEEEAGGWKIRAMQSEQQRQSLRDLLIIAEGQRDQAKADAEHWKGEWAVVLGQLGGARAEVEALRKAVDAVRATRTEPQTRTGDNDDWVDGFQYGYAAALETVNDAIDAAMAVRPTTGGGDE